ncbi:aldehyde dehydrogenase (NADP(+)) [Micromonospora sp. NPDC005113]
MSIASIDPRTGEAVETVAQETGVEEVDRLARAAADAFVSLEDGGRPLRAALLEAFAEELESRRARIVELGMRETALPEARLNGELTRTVFQCRFFRQVVEDGGYLEATIDHAGDTPMGPGRDLRRMLVPIGPVAVFGASNFPLAFSVPGGDTVSALAAGCPVIVKAHDSHPALSLLTFEALEAAVARVGAPAGTVGLVFGTAAGAALVAHPAVKAVGFTGSLSGGRALMRIAADREEPIPFYGELSSLNPVVLTAGAVADDAAGIAGQLVASVTGSGGQLCTKPGLVLVPAGPDGDRFVREAATLVDQTPAITLLNGRIAASYADGSERFTTHGTRVVARGLEAGGGFAVRPELLEVAARDLTDLELEECFGPLTVLVRYAPDEMDGVLDRLPGSLTGSIWCTDDEEDEARRLSRVFAAKSGRVLFNGWPTGVLVAWAQHHGGPWPATNTGHTSVGATAIRRFLRPVAWQDAPDSVLPPELRDDFDGIPRRINGVVQIG